MKLLVSFALAALAWIVADEVWIALAGSNAPTLVQIALSAGAFAITWLGYWTFFEQKGGSGGTRRR